MDNNIKYTKINIDTIGQKVKTRRKLMHMTQKELADLVGVTFQQIQKYEAGINKISLQLLLKLCDIFHCHIGYFLESDVSIDTDSAAVLFDISSNSIEQDTMEDELLLAFRKIKILKLKVAILDLVKCISCNRL